MVFMTQRTQNFLTACLIISFVCIGLYEQITSTRRTPTADRLGPQDSESDAAERLRSHGANLTINSLGHVTSVSFKHNREVSLICIENLRHLPMLTHLYLEYSNLDDSMTAPMGDLKRIKHLSLNGTNITRETMRQVGKLTTLESLNLRALAHHKDGIGDDGLSELAPLDQLRVLNLTMNMDISPTGFHVLENLTSLRSLYLTDTRFDQRSVGYLTKLKRLSVLHTPDLSPFKLRAISHLPIRILNCGKLESRDVEHLTRFKNLEALPSHPDHYIDDTNLRHLTKLTKIKTLSLSEGSVSDHGLIRLPELPHIESLTITTNGSDYPEIKSDGLKRLTQFKNLRHLTLVALKVDDEFLEAIGNLQKLETLELQYLPITGIGFQHLRNENLHHISLEGSKIENETLGYLSQLPKLKNLELHDTPVNNEGLRALSSSKQLRSLRLRSTSVDSNGIQHLVALPNLRRLDVSFTRMDNDAIQQLSDCKSLEELNVSNCEISDVGFNNLSKLSSIKAIAIYNTQVSWEAADALWRHSNKECWITDNWCCGCMNFSGPESTWKYY